MLIDWSVVIEPQNYKILHRPDSRSLADLLASMFCILLVAAALIGYVGIRSRILDLGYEVQRLQATEDSLRSTQSILKTEEEMLTSPGHIDDYARNQLAMQPLSPYQRLMPSYREFNAPPGPVILANMRSPSIQPRRTSANN